MFDSDGHAADLLQEAVAGLLAQDPSLLPATEALGRLAGMLEARERLQAAVLAAVRDLDVRELYALDGAGSARGWLRTQVGGEDGQVALARSLGQHDAVRTALAGGRISLKAAGQLCTALAKVPAELDEPTVRALLHDGVRPLLTAGAGGTVVEAEPVLQDCADATTCAPADRLAPAFVLLAEHLTPTWLSTALRSLVDPLLPDGSEGDGLDPYYVELRPLYDGDWDLRGLLDSETGLSLKAELDRRQQARGDAPGQPEVPDLVASVADPADAFTADSSEPLPARRSTPLLAGRRRHDALTDLLRAARATGGSTDAPAVPFTVVATLDTLLGTAGAPAALLDVPGRPPLALSSPALQRLGCSAELAAVLLDAAGNPLGASTTRRAANRRERRALRAKWGPCCAVRGCPSTATVPHHVRPWWLSHRTDLVDLVPLCEHCHRDLHEGHRTLRLRDRRWIDEHGWTQPPETALRAA